MERNNRQKEPVKNIKNIFGSGIEYNDEERFPGVIRENSIQSGQGTINFNKPEKPVKREIS